MFYLWIISLTVVVYWNSESSVECLKDSGIKPQPILIDLLFSKTNLITLVYEVWRFFWQRNRNLTNKIVWSKHLLLIMHTFKRFYYFTLKSNTKISPLIFAIRSKWNDFSSKINKCLCDTTINLLCNVLSYVKFCVDL